MSMTERGTVAQFKPAPGSAGAFRMVLSHAKFEFGLILRNGEQILLTLIIPLAAMLGLNFVSGIDLGTDDRIQVIAPGTIALAILATAFASQAISTGFDRRYGVIKLLGTTPLSRGRLLASRILAILAVEVVQIVLILILGIALGWRAEGNALFALVFIVLGTISLTALALLLAGTLRAEATLAVANAVFLLLMFVGGVMIPLTNAPAWMASAASLLPSGALGEGLRMSMSTGGFDGSAALVLVIWGVLGTLFTIKFFKWE
ncbi:MAG: ABC transporter permease [Candidatus Nanopelagicales bacterium]